MARAIDSEAAYRFLSEQLVKETGAFSKGVNKGLNIARSAMRNPDAIPTLTQPNETPPCYRPDGDGCAYQCYDGDDEPIDKCKECPLCYSDKQRHHAPPNEWVSVENALPPEHEPVLCIVNGKPKPNITLKDAYQLGSWNKADGWIIDEWLDWEGANVTWWMKLPETPDRRPPEGEEDT